MMSAAFPHPQIFWPDFLEMINSPAKMSTTPRR